MDVNFLKHNSAVSTETRISCVVEGAGVGVCVYGVYAFSYFKPAFSRKEFDNVDNLLGCIIN